MGAIGMVEENMKHNNAIVIWGYGDKMAFASLADAVEAIHACGGDFASVELRETSSGRNRRDAPQ